MSAAGAEAGEAIGGAPEGERRRDYCESKDIIRRSGGQRNDIMYPSVLPPPPQRLNEQTAHLKDQLQELKAKTSLEAKYITKESQVGKGSSGNVPCSPKTQQGH